MPLDKQNIILDELKTELKLDQDTMNTIVKELTYERVDHFIIQKSKPPPKPRAPVKRKNKKPVDEASSETSFN